MNLADRIRLNSQVSLLLDCNGICHALHHTMGDLSHNGQETGIIFGFLLQLFSLQKRFHPHRWVFAWDSRESLRRKIDPEYKANRKVSQNDPGEKLRWENTFAQFDCLREKILPMLGFARGVLYLSGYEADDLIAGAVELMDGKKIIISQDHDLYQLLQPNCSIYNTKMRAMFTEQDFWNRYGVASEQWVDVKAIAGCPGDNVKGIPRVGEGTAIKYLRGELSKSSKTYDAIVGNWSQVVLNRQLVRLPFMGCQSILREQYESLSKNGALRMSEEGFQTVCKQYGFDSFLVDEKYGEWGRLFGWGR